MTEPYNLHTIQLRYKLMNVQTLNISLPKELVEITALTYFPSCLPSGERIPMANSVSFGEAVGLPCGLKESKYWLNVTLDKDGALGAPTQVRVLAL